MLTLSEALKTDRLEDFIKQQETAGADRRLRLRF